jgi:hypothetical protein
MFNVSCLKFRGSGFKVQISSRVKVQVQVGHVAVRGCLQGIEGRSEGEISNSNHFKSQGPEEFQVSSVSSLKFQI